MIHLQTWVVFILECFLRTESCQWAWKSTNEFGSLGAPGFGAFARDFMGFFAVGVFTLSVFSLQSLGAGPTDD